MFDDDEDRLLIDDHEQSGDCGEKEKLSPKTDERVNFTPPSVEASNFPETNGVSVVSAVNTIREEGELDDEEMDTSRSPAKPVQEKPAVQSDRKRPNGDHVATAKNTNHSPKRSKTTSKSEVYKREQGTCVHPKASQADTDESPFEMEAGSSFVMQMTVVCRLEGTNTVFISGKWKDQELSGVLTDGEPPGFFNFAKKRNALSNNAAGSESEKSNMGTPSKNKRMGRSNDGKKKTATKADEDEEELDVTGTAESREGGGGGFIKLAEVPPRTSMHTCPSEGCEHRYESSAEMEYHIDTTHKKRSVMYENNCSQTEREVVPKKEMVSVFTDTEGLELPQVKVEMVDRASSAMEPPPTVVKVEGIVKSPSSRFSDISDDAPQLQKEEPQQPTEGYANGLPSRPSTSTPATAASLAAATSTPTPQAPVAQPSAVVPPVAASPRAVNGLLMPAGFPPGGFMSPFTPVAGNSSIGTPGRDQNKLNQLKDAANMAEAVAATHTPVKPISSPAQNRTPFAVPPMVAHPVVSAAQNSMAQHQQQQQAQMLQQLQMQQMMSAYHPQMRMFSMGGPNPAQDQMAQLAAMQQALQNAPFSMFPKHG